MYQINIQRAAQKTAAPKSALLRKWGESALKKKVDSGEITIRIVTVDEMTELNGTYRGKSYATNVLSFPFSVPDEIPLDIPILGDIVICADVVNREAKEQGKDPDAHWAHMIIHGVFHLLGYDHEIPKEAQVMEALEIEVMGQLGFVNPYERGVDIKHYEKKA